MKELLQQYSAYNLWANKKIIEALSQLPDDQITKEIISSFSSIMKTLLHMLDAESIWWQRLKLNEHIERPSEQKVFDFKMASEELLQFSAKWKEWVNKTNEINLTHVFEYRNTKKELFKQPVYEVVMHMINHSTYHRGQLIVMMRQLGINKIPNTDLISFFRKK